MVASIGRTESIHRVEQRIDAVLSQALDLLADLVAVDTSFPPGEGYGELADVIETWFHPLGFSFERVTVPEHLWRTRRGQERGDRINLLVRMPGELPVCAMYFHMDVVPAGPNWTTNPHMLTRVDDRLIGRGSVDMKGAIAAVYAALQGLLPGKIALAYRPHLLFCTDEEGGTYPGIRHLAETGRIDGHLLSFNGKAAPRVWGGCFGSIDLVIEIQGRSAHSGDACDGINAIEESLPLLNRLFELKTAVEQRASSLAPPPDWPAGGTLNERLTIAAVNAGHKGSSLPGQCRILINRRYAPETDFATVMAELETIIASAMARSRAVAWHIEIIGHLAPVADPTGPHWPRWQAAMAHGFGFEPGAFRKYGASSSSDMGWVQQAGIQEILLGGLVRPNSNAHGADEFTTTSDIRALARSVATYLAADFAPSLIPGATVATTTAGDTS